MMDEIFAVLGGIPCGIPKLLIAYHNTSSTNPVKWFLSSIIFVAALIFVKSFGKGENWGTGGTRNCRHTRGVSFTVPQPLSGIDAARDGDDAGARRTSGGKWEES